MRILIADDDPVSRLVLRRTLEAQGHDVTDVADGVQALDRIDRDGFPVVISDWMMPQMDGPALCRAIRSGEALRLARGYGRRYTYVLLLTSLEGKANYLEAMDAGADDFLTKPLDRELIQARLGVAQRVLGLHREVQTLAGLLPICSYCKKIREAAVTPGRAPVWSPVEVYVSHHSGASFTHSVCPACYESQVKPQLDALQRGGAGPA
jgi:CheY-like chemotaxis protein